MLSLPAADHLVAACLMWWVQKHLVWRTKATPTLERRMGSQQKKHENEGMIERWSPYILVFFPNKTGESRLGRGGRDCPAYPPPLHGYPDLYSPPSFPPAPHTGQSHVPLTFPRLGAPTEMSLLWSTAEEDMSHRASLSQLCCLSSSWVFNNTQTQALSCPKFSKDWLSGQIFFIYNCPFKAIFCSFFLWNQQGCHHIIAVLQWHFQARPGLDQAVCQRPWLSI